MTKYLITGVGGFVGKHLLRFLNNLDEPIELLGLDRTIDESTLPEVDPKWQFVQTDLMIRDVVSNLVTTFKPDRIIHLAASSSVGESWREPAECFVNNMTSLFNLYDAVRLGNIRCRILSIGSSEVYGDPGNDMEPLREDRLPAPLNPYAVARLAQEQMTRIYVEAYGLDIVSTRSFLHIGPGQTERFAVASFVRQLVDAKNLGQKNAALLTGNVDLIRDFSDARDVVRAYYSLLQKGKKGQIYNICQGKGFSLRDIINMAADILEIKATVRIDENRLRLDDPQRIVGSAEKIRQETGWTPEIPMPQTLTDMINV